MKLVAQPIKDSPYYDVVDIEPALAPGTRVIRASYCTKAEAELFASAPMMRLQLAHIADVAIWKGDVGLYGRFMDWVTRGWYATRILRRPRPTWKYVTHPFARAPAETSA